LLEDYWLDEDGKHQPKIEEKKSPTKLAEKVIDTSKFSKGMWTDKEHELFLEALLIHGKHWDLIQIHI